jgi:TatD DNase family protein
VIDTHCHLDGPAFDADRAQVLARARAAGVAGVLVPGVRPTSWPETIALGAHAGVAIALGVHPQCVPELGPAELAVATDPETLASAIARVGAAAVGECGLDGATASLELQEQILRTHVRAARALGLPLVVHVLRAHHLAPRILREERADEVGGVLHSYSGGVELVPVYRDLGLAFSFAGPITYTNARRPVDAARAIPDELLLVETDAPDQAPEPHRGGRSEPAFVARVIEGLARARGAAAGAIAALTAANARRIFSAAVPRWSPT